MREGGIAGLAATYSSAPWGAVPSAQRVFTAEFGMGSGVWPLAMATRPAMPGPRDARRACSWLEGRRSGGLSCEGGREVSGGAAGRGLAAARGRLVRKRGLRGDRALIRAISTGQLNGLPRFHLRPIDVVVFHGSRRDLVLRRVSRLDAFSGYPVRT